MLRSRLVSTLAASLLAVACASVAPAPAASSNEARQTQPNILFILVDDMGWRDVGYAGSPVYQTPAIDRLAADGTRFDQAYVAFPRCVPSRYALMTGRNPARSQIPGGPGGEHMKAAEVTLAEALKAGGYHTFFAGKWHLGKNAAEMPEGQGFDVNIAGGSAGAVASHFFPYGAEKGRALGPGLEQGQEGEYLTDRLTRETVSFIEQHERSNPNQPFFAMLSHYAVHTPIESRADMQRAATQRIASVGGMNGDAYINRDGQTRQYQNNAAYAGMVASMDQSVASLRAALDRLGISDETIIVFTSDHGGLSNRSAQGGREVATSNLPLRAGKGHLYEGGIRVPMVVYWPGHTRAGSVNTDVTINTDHFPALLQAAGLNLQPDVHADGISWLPAATGGRMQTAPRFWYNAAPRPGQTGDTASAAVRDGQWKYFLSFDASVPSQLFDLSADPAEGRDLSAQQPARAQAMKAQIEGWMRSINAVDPATIGRGRNRGEDAGEGRRNRKGEQRGNRRQRRNAEELSD